MKVKELFEVLKKTKFESYFVDFKTHSASLVPQVFTAKDFGFWEYGISNQGRLKNRFIFTIQFWDEGELATKTKTKDTIEDVFNDESIIEMEVVEIKELSLKGYFDVSYSNTAWPCNQATIEIVVSKSK